MRHIVKVVANPDVISLHVQEYGAWQSNMYLAKKHALELAIDILKELGLYFPPGVTQATFNAAVNYVEIFGNAGLLISTDIPGPQVKTGESYKGHRADFVVLDEFADAVIRDEVDTVD